MIVKKMNYKRLNKGNFGVQPSFGGWTAKVYQVNSFLTMDGIFLFK